MVLLIVMQYYSVMLTTVESLQLEGSVENVFRETELL